MSHSFAHRAGARLILYVLDDSRSCAIAVESAYRALRRFPRGSIELMIRNLSRVFESDRTARDRTILIVPTLVMLRPREGYVIGPLDSLRIVDFVRSAGIAPNADPEEDA